MKKYKCILILGPTACGKTKLAVQTALNYNGEIISVDSRQVYKKINIGTGKDLKEYETNGKKIPHHLIDIIEPTNRYHVKAFANDFYEAFDKIINKNKLPILCGGTGLYMDVILKKNDLIGVPLNPAMRISLLEKSTEELKILFDSYKYAGKYTFDTSTSKRLIRAIEILEFLKTKSVPEIKFHELNPLIIGVKTTLEQRRERISKRLKDRIENGLIEEAEELIKNGIPHQQLQYFGLEYKFLSYYLLGKISKQEMISQLETAIHQYAKRQMTWWRKMERDGFAINWVNSIVELDTFLTT